VYGAVSPISADTQSEYGTKPIPLVNSRNPYVDESAEKSQKKKKSFKDFWLK
jgi:hypothetical protein